MSRTAEILQKALEELGAKAEEEPAPSNLELLLAESIKLANLTKVAQRISKSDFEAFFEEMKGRYSALHDKWTYYSVLGMYDMCNGNDFEDTVAGRELALKAYKHLQICIAQLEVSA